MEEAVRDLDYQITLFQTRDFCPGRDAMIRLGAYSDHVSPTHNVVGDETALSICCKMIPCDLEECHGRISPGRLRIIHRLLQVGVDPNIGYALYSVCEAGDVDTAALLLRYGADSSIERLHDGR